MNTFKRIFLLVLIMSAAFMQAQTAEEIINTYFENTGGIEAWKNLENTKMSASVNQGGMVIPITLYNTLDGKQAVIIEIQGQKITQMAFDGTTGWSTNFQTMAAEKLNQEMTDNLKLTVNDFPSPLLNYKENGYTVEYMGTETQEGTETYKVKVVQKPTMINGVETANVSYYYFDTENNVPILIESTQGGQQIKIAMSDYQEVDGLYFPFAMTQMGMPVSIDSIELNVEIDDSLFAFPEGE